jgi:transcriptional regulator with XRE-family HTH domain
MTAAEKRRAAHVKAIRAALSFTQVDLAMLLGVHPITVSKWERGTLKMSPWQFLMLDALRQGVERVPTVGWRARERLRNYGAAYALQLLLDASFFVGCPAPLP